MNPHRTQWPLDGPWRLKDEPDLNSTQLPYTEPGFDDSDWREVPPATHLQPWLYPDNPYWGAHVREINDSAWWYRTRFALPQEAQGRRVRLFFEAVDYYAEVWCNGHRLGLHEGNFGTFWFDVTDIVRAENTLAVKVTAPWDPVRRKGLTYVDEVYRGMVKGLYAHDDGLVPRDANPIGIWRPVWLQAHNGVTIERISYDVVEDEYDRSAQLTLRLHVYNQRPETISGVLHVHLAGETFQSIRANDHYAAEIPPGEQIVEQTVRIPDPQWWWPWDMGRPDLYRVRCALWEKNQLLDECEQVLGIRQLRLLRARKTLHYQVNKVPLFIRGTTYMGALYFSQLTVEQIESDLERVRECGLNLIRLHVHVAPPEVYEACDRLGLMIWQDFELNWLHDPSPEFEDRALRVLREMIYQRGAHASIITWCCHNEPTALPFQDVNLRERPDPRLLGELMALDPSRPRFICSGKQEQNWQHAGDTHAYIGGGHGGQYPAVYGKKSQLVTEFGCEAPPTVETFEDTPLLTERLAHVRDRIGDIHQYQAALIKYQIEWYRQTRYEPCGGYIQFMFADLYPQVGCGVLDVARRARPAFEALKSASQPVHAMMEYTADGPIALWVVNDLPRPLLRCLVEWELRNERGDVVTRGSAREDIPAQRAHRVSLLAWKIDPERTYTVMIRLLRNDQLLDENRYEDPFHMPPRPKNYPWHFDPVLGMRCYGGPHARSSLRVLNTWYGRLARLIFPIHDWAENMLAEPKMSSRLGALLKRIYG
jgi:beta-mannosidase